MESAGSIGLSAVISEDSSEIISSGAEDTADAEDASAEGGAVDWTFVDDAGGEEGWSAVAVVSLHPARETQRIRDKNSVSKRFVMFMSLYIIQFHTLCLLYREKIETLDKYIVIGYYIGKLKTRRCRCGRNSTHAG